MSQVVRPGRTVVCGLCGLRYEELDYQVPSVSHGKCPRCSAREQQYDETRDVNAGRSDHAYEELPANVPK